MGLFGGAAKQQKPPPAPVVPSVDAANLAQEDELAKLARRRGFAANLVTGDQGLKGNLGPVGSTRLLGG